MNATMTKEDMKRAETYKQPEASVNMPILWYMNGVPSQTPFAGFVIAVGGNTIDVELHAPNGAKRVQMGVRHITDPRARQIELSQAGAWDYTEDGKLLRKIAAIVLKTKGSQNDEKQSS